MKYFVYDEVMSNGITGLVVRGDGRGRQIGFPTANLELEGEPQPVEEGIWACWCQLAGDETVYMGALHAGPRPAVHDDTPRVEVHMLDFVDRDLYGERLAVQPVQKIRAIADFASLEALQEGIRRDCEEARRILEERV